MAIRSNSGRSRTFSVHADLFHEWDDGAERNVLMRNIPAWKEFADSLGERLGRRVGIPQAWTWFVYALENGAIETFQGHWRGNLADDEVVETMVAFIRSKDASFLNEVLADRASWHWHEQLMEEFREDRKCNAAYVVEHDDPSYWRPDYTLYYTHECSQTHISFENVPQWMKLAELISGRTGRRLNFVSVFDLFMEAMVEDAFHLDGNIWKGCVYRDEVVESLLGCLQTAYPWYLDCLADPDLWMDEEVEYDRCKELGLSDWCHPACREEVPQANEDDVAVDATEGREPQAGTDADGREVQDGSDTR